MILRRTSEAYTDFTEKNDQGMIQFNIFNEDKHLVIEKNKLKFYNPIEQKITKINKNKNLYISDISMKINFDVDIFVGGKKPIITINKKYKTKIKMDRDEKFIFSFSYDKRFYFITTYFSLNCYNLYILDLEFYRVYDFISNKMENYFFSEKDILLVRFLMEDFLFPIPKFKHFPEKNKFVKVLFNDGMREISHEKMYDLQSDYIVGLIENCKQDEEIDIFSGISFYDFEKCFYTNLRANNHLIYFLLHKISSLIFSKVAIDFIKILSKIGDLFDDEDLYEILYEEISKCI